MSAGGIPQIALARLLHSWWGLHTSNGDESIMVKGNRTVFLAGPPLAKAATGAKVSVKDLGGAIVHCRTLGVSDYFARGLVFKSYALQLLFVALLTSGQCCLYLADELHALAIGRSIIKNLHMARGANDRVVPDFKEPLYDVDKLRSIGRTDLEESLDIRSIIARIVDGSEFDEFKKFYGTVRVKTESLKRQLLQLKSRRAKEDRLQTRLDFKVQKILGTDGRRRRMASRRRIDTTEGGGG
ncbi:Hypothetical predicted protein [Olea europaea subsp. europaea]|uniref:Acetyl-coenzyme A carboxylase carboxyl transferase subunit beta domain-containing protein n=1 Tax=Olea europaea subsp. europaea TaxID=158383 RepID=A0A8S0TW30_OLEEU|nr:Hypothetical predicted protein [Olea europaea subsp. europaea]